MIITRLKFKLKNKRMRTKFSIASLKVDDIN